jgi:hypothetical protein
VPGEQWGVKRPRSESRTLSSVTQQTKKPRSTQWQTGSYKEAVAGIKMAVTHRCHPDVTLDETQVDLIQGKSYWLWMRTLQARRLHSFCTLNLHRGYSGSPVQMSTLRSG